MTLSPVPVILERNKAKHSEPAARREANLISNSQCFHSLCGQTYQTRRHSGISATEPGVLTQVATQRETEHAV